VKRNVLFALSTLGFLVFFFSCKKINEPTELGGDLLPAIDNVNTFDTTLEVLASYHTSPEYDTAYASDNLALGQINDPLFGSTNAGLYFNLSSSKYSSLPFINKAAVTIDSVVLSLAYAGVYGDSSAAVTVAVSEIAQDNGFNDSSYYRYDHPEFVTVGPVLGNRLFVAADLEDSLTIARQGDTTKVANVLRIRLDNSLGQRFAQYDTANNGPYTSDSLFRAAFRGLAVKTTGASGSGALAYFNLLDAGTALYVYYKSKKTDGSDTSGTATFIHSTYRANNRNYLGIANAIVRTPGADYLAGLNLASPQKLYLQSSPAGSYVGMSIPGLSNFPNKVIHRAELIAYRLPSLQDNFFGPPSRLLLDRKDSTGLVRLFDNDIQYDANGSVSLGLFGGTLGKDGSYHFNITRYVQGIVTKKEHNDSLRLSAPLRSDLFSQAYRAKISVPVISNIAAGRVVIAGDNYPADAAKRLRLRIVYSNL
jgi:hypothetical protein